MHGPPECFLLVRRQLEKRPHSLFGDDPVAGQFRILPARVCGCLQLGLMGDLLATDPVGTGFDELLG